MSPGWWNGRHWRLKISWPHGRTGSSPVPGIEKSEFDTIKFWLFYFPHHKELQILPCNVKEHIGPNNKAFLAYLCNENEHVVRFYFISFTRL